MGLLHQVVGLKMECDVAGFERDPEGLAIAAAINTHLPRQVHSVVCLSMRV